MLRFAIYSCHYSSVLDFLLHLDFPYHVSLDLFKRLEIFRKERANKMASMKLETSIIIIFLITVK